MFVAQREDVGKGNLVPMVLANSTRKAYDCRPVHKPDVVKDNCTGADLVRAYNTLRRCRRD